jgi:hypothetical protein
VDGRRYPVFNEVLLWKPSGRRRAPAAPGLAVVACMMCLVDLHPELAELADLLPGWIAERERPGSAWYRSELAEDE